MAVPTQNRAGDNKAPNYTLPEHIQDNAEVIAAQLPIQIGTPPLPLNYPQQSPQLGESSRQLAGQKIDRSRWSSTILHTMNLPSISGALNYILKRAAFIPSILYRKIDLPLFRRRRKPRIVSPQSGTTFSDSQQNVSNLQTGELFTEIPLHYSDDKAEENQSSRISDEAYPAIIRNLFSPPATVNRMVVIRHESGIISPTTLMPPMVAPLEIVNQANVTDDSATSHDNRSQSPVNDIFQITGNRHIVNNQARANPNKSTMPSKHSRYMHTDQISSRTLSPFKQRISRQQEISGKNKTGNPVQESLDISAQDSSPPDTINIKQKPIIKSVRQMKPHYFTDKSYASLSEEVPAHYDTGSYHIAGTGQAALSKAQTLPDTAFEQNIPTINRADSRKAGQSSISRVANNLRKHLLKSSAVNKVELSEEIPDNYHIDAHPVTGVEKLTFSKSETTPSTTSKQNNHTVNRAVSRKPGQSSIKELPGNYTRQSSIASQSQKPEPSEEIVDEGNIESQPVTGPEKSITTESGTSSDTVYGQNTTGINRAVSRKPSQSSIKEIPGNRARQSLKPSSPLKIAYNQEASLLTGLLADTQANNARRSRTGKSVKAQSTEHVQRTYEAMHIPEDTNKSIYDHEKTNIVAPKQDRIDEGPVKINLSTQLSNLRTHVADIPNIRTYPSIGTISSQIAPISQRILKTTGYMSSSETNENDVVLQDTGNILASPSYRHTSQQLQNLPVVSPARPKTDPWPAHPEELFRTMSDTLPDMTRPKSYTTPNLALVPTVMTAERASADQTIVNRQQIENTNDQVAAPNIRIIADKVYALLRQELKIERERERHRLLR